MNFYQIILYPAMTLLFHEISDEDKLIHPKEGYVVL